MKRLIFGLLFAALSVCPVLADSTINNLSSGAALSGTEQIPMFQASNPAVTTTPNAIKTFVGGVTSIATSCGVSGGTITTTGTVRAQETPSSQTGANYAFQDTDCGKLINLSNGSNQIPTLGAANSGTQLFASGGFVDVCNQGAGTQTLTPTTSTIGGASTYVLTAGTAAAPRCVTVVSDGTNYQVIPYAGLVSFVASGTAALGTGAISSATCATAVTVAATGVLTTDIVTASFNSDPHAVTGYIPSTSGMLTIIGYPTSGNVNFLVCNNTSGSITPGAITLNWRVAR